MSRDRPVDGPALVTWGYYAVLEIPEIPPNMVAEKTSFPTERVEGFDPQTWRPVIVAVPEQRAFWAAWFSERPTAETWVEPDNFGFVTGPQAWSEAITIADRAVRTGKSARVYARHIGEHFARLAFRDGAPIVRSDFTDFTQKGMESLAFFQLRLDAKPKDVRAAFRDHVFNGHPDRRRDQHGTRVDMHELKRKRDFAIGFLRMQRKKGKAPPT